MLVGVCVCVPVCAGAHVCVYMCGGQRSTSNAIPQVLCFFFLITFKHLSTNCVSVHKPV